MIVKKVWRKYFPRGALRYYEYCGYFLFGFIPLYITKTPA